MKIRITSNIRTLIAKEEQKERRQITSAEIAREAKLATNTVRNLSLGKTRRVDIHVLENLIAYFNERGNDYGLDDLFTIEVA